MKKQVFTFCFLLSLKATAQPVFQNSNLVTGINFEVYQVTNPGTSNPSPNGAGITWDFTSAQVNKVGDASFIDATQTPIATIYPDANFAVQLTPVGSTTSYYILMKKSADKLEVIYDGSPGNNTIFTNYRTEMVFPFNYNASYSDDYQKQGQSMETRIYDYTAYGTILSSLGTFNNIAKITNSVGYIYFWNTNPIHPLIQIESITDITFWKPVTTTLNDLKSKYELEVYPIPTLDKQLFIKNAKQGDWIEVYDMLGKLYFSQKNNETLFKIDLSVLPAGNYFMRVGEQVRKVILK